MAIALVAAALSVLPSTAQFQHQEGAAAWEGKALRMAGIQR